MATATMPTFAESICPTRLRSNLAYDLITMAAGVALITACARLVLVLPISPVPVTGQTFGVLLVGALLGARRGAMTVLTYLAIGAAGLPVLAGGAAGFAYMIGPTGGYLLGFLPAAWLVGALAERGWDRRVATAALAMTLGTVLIFAIGMLWLGALLGPEQAIPLGLLPFIPGAIIKIAAGCAALPVGWAVLNWLRRLA